MIIAINLIEKSTIEHSQLKERFWKRQYLVYDCDLFILLIVWF